MSDLTPEAARAAAAWLETLDPCGYSSAAYVMRAEADRLEAAAKTPGQVLVEVRGLSWAGVLTDSRRNWEEAAAAVIAHVVGPDRVVVDRDDLYAALNDPRTKPSVIDRLREALS